MSPLLSGLLSFILLYKYASLFVIIFCAAVIVPLPANTTVLAVGAFVSQGYFSFSGSLITIFIANVLGDCVGYYLIRHYGQPLIKWLRIKDAKWFRQLERYIRRQAGLTIFLTRFVNSIGSLTNFLAGIAEVPFFKFLAYDMLGNFVNIGLFLFIGYFVGTQWINLSGLFAIAGLIITVLVLIIAVVGIFLRG